MAKLIAKHNLCVVVREYEDAQGQTKKVWRTIGELVTMETEHGQSTFCDLYHMPGARISVFKPRKKEQKPQENQELEKKEEEINVEDIPF